MKKEVFQKLARRSYHSQELYADLLKKGHTKEEVVPLLEELSKDGYISDADWEESFFQTALQKGWSPLEARAKLKTRGISAPSLLARLKDEEERLISRLVEKKYRSKDPEKVRAALYRKGFTLEAISRILTCLLLMGCKIATPL